VKTHKHRFVYLEMHAAMQKIHGARYMGVCVEGAFPAADEAGYVDCARLCSEKSYAHSLPPGYSPLRVLDGQGQPTGKTHPSHGYAFSRAALTEQMGTAQEAA